MSFSFNAMGSKADVIRQIRSHRHDGQAFADQVRDLLVAAIEQDTESHLTTYGGGYCYIVEATGHAGGGLSSMHVKLEARWIPQLVEEELGTSEPVEVKAEIPGQTRIDGEPILDPGYADRGAAEAGY